MLDPKILKEIKNIQLTAGHLASEALAGNYASAFKGQGMEFAEVREYIPGDDVRTIDWNVTARMSVPYIKKFREERELTLMILIDVSASQSFGSQKRSKERCSTELAAVLTFLATRNNDKVGVILFADEVEHYIPPKKGRAHIWHIIRSVLTHKRHGGKTRIDRALDFLLKTQKKQALVFLISDFLSDGYETSLKIVSRRHELICVLSEDQRERRLPAVGSMALLDPETLETFTVYAGRQEAKSFAAAARARRAALFSEFKRNRIEHFTLDSGEESAAAPLVKFLRKRQSQRRKLRR